MATDWKQVAKFAADMVVPFGGQLVESLTKSTSAVVAASEKGLDALKDEIAKQELKLGFEMKQAKISQELAIAQRISNAETVEIEEFYDTSGRGHLGLKGEEQSITLGLGAEGKRVVRRLYKFIGWRARAEDDGVHGPPR